MKFLRRKDHKPDLPPPPPVVPDAPPQLDALPLRPPPLYARFATGASFENLDGATTTATPRPNSVSASPQSRDSVAYSVNTTSTKSSDVPRPLAPARPVVKLVSKPRKDTTSSAQSSHAAAPTSPPAPASRRETSSSEGTRPAKPRPTPTSSLPNPFLPPLLRQRDSGINFADAGSYAAGFNGGTQQQQRGPRDMAQKRVGERSQLCGTPGHVVLTTPPLL
jgi:hypothetical protein